MPHAVPHAARRRLIVLSAGLLALALGLGGVAQAQTPHAALIDMDGVISPAMARYLDRSLAQAAEDGAVLAIVRLDTPGGRLDATRDMVGTLLEAPLPVVVYVAPAGARAASAGTFIAAAAHFAVMAPGTNIGAATPISSTGDDLPPTLARKVREDASAFMRSIAEERGRDADALVATVLDAKAYTATEAVDLGIVDFLAGGTGEIIARLDGQTVTIRRDGQVVEITLATAGVEVRALNPRLIDRFVFFISDPNVAYLLLTLGTLAVLIEVVSAFSLIGAGLAGLVLWGLAVVGLGNMPVSWLAVALVAASAVLTSVEMNVDGFGVFGGAAIASFVAGSLLLFLGFGTVSPTWSGQTVSLVILVPILVLVVLVGGGALYGWIRARHAPPVIVAPALVGQVGRTLTPLDPSGMAFVHGENWSVRLVGSASGDARVEEGSEVEVMRVDGSTLEVRPRPGEEGPGPTAEQDGSSEKT